MEPDAQVQPETTGVEETQEETTSSEDTVSEDVKDTSEDKGGDLRVALRQEREARQRLEKSMSDAHFIYEQAKRLGLTDEQAQDLADDDREGSRRISQPEPDVSAQVRRAIRLEKAVDKYPDLKTDEELGVMVSSLIAMGQDPVEAADKVFSRFNKIKDEGKAQGAKEKEKAISDKERAQTAPVAGTQSAEQAEMERLQKDLRSFDKSVRDAAHLEILKRRNKQVGV